MVTAIDIYAPAQSIPFMDQFKSIHDTYEKEKKKGPEDEGPPKKETVRLNGTSYGKNFYDLGYSSGIS